MGLTYDLISWELGENPNAKITAARIAAGGGSGTAAVETWLIPVETGCGEMRAAVVADRFLTPTEAQALFNAEVFGK